MLHERKIGFAHAVGGIATTLYYSSLRDSIRKRPDFTANPGPNDLILPAEDTSMETNWPRYASGDPAANRGIFHIRSLKSYLWALRFSSHPVLLVNMQPFIRVPLIMAQCAQVIVADINLLDSERARNPRTISLPGMPITVGTFRPSDKHRLASFRGVDSHPVRQALMALNGVAGITCEIVSPANHFGKIDAQKNQIDQEYYQLLNESIFAIVPRGDAHFSYRLLEVMSFGCIPIILSDGLILPFDRTIPWETLSVHVAEGDVERIPDILARFTPDQIAEMQRNVVRCYHDHLGNFDVITQTMIAEAEGLMPLPPYAGETAILALALSGVGFVHRAISLVKHCLRLSRNVFRQGLVHEN